MTRPTDLGTPWERADGGGVQADTGVHGRATDRGHGRAGGVKCWCAWH